MIRTIPLKIQNEYITGDKGMIGAAGSHNDVILRMEFSGMWDGLTKMVQFRDALGEATIEVLLTADMLEADNTSVYLVPVPNGAKKYAGEMTLCIKGAAVSAQKETRATLAVYGRFTVAESKWNADAETEADVPASNVEKLQGQIDNVLATIVDARKAATEAAKSEAAAKNAAETAAVILSATQNSAQNASESAKAAEKSAQDASQKYTFASAAANDAATFAQKAANSATAAKASEDAAAGSAANAAASATSAGKSASAASEKASDAASSASAAATSAQTAQSEASAASAAAEAASGSASQAQASAAAAAKSAASVDGINKTAQSWAVGGTGTREGEDTNNAKYWAEQAQQAAGGGVVSFNGRAGSVVPQAGDYDKGMVGLGNVDNTSDLAKPISNATQKELNAKPSMVIAEIPNGRMRGDVDGDGKITENDVDKMSNHINDSEILTGVDFWCADVDANDKVNSTDLNIVYKFLKGQFGKLTSTPTFADYYNNWTYHKVDDTAGYWTTELSIPAITTETAGSIIWGGTGFTGTFIKAEPFSGGVRIYANYPPIEALPCAVSYHTGAGGQFIISNTGASETGAKYVIVALTASGWSEEKKQIISVPGLKEDVLKQLIIPTQPSTDIEKYYSAGIRISARGDNTLTFSCDTIPTASIEVVLVIIPIIGKFEG